MWWSVPILAGYMIASNVLLYRGLLPPKSKLQLIEEDGAADEDDDGEYAGTCVRMYVRVCIWRSVCVYMYIPGPSPAQIEAAAGRRRR
jgi:hypothetical protein